MSRYPEIDALRERVRAARPLSEGELNRLRGEFAVENTYDSNAIEGNTLTLRETALILQRGVTIAEKPLRAHLEAVGHRDAFEYVVSLADAGEALSERVIREIHALVLMNDRANAGAYRRVPVAILGSARTPPAPEFVSERMESLIAEYRAESYAPHPIDAVARFHVDFEGIHPFIDGNGRTGRLILNLELIKAGLLPVNIKYADRRKYYDCFETGAESLAEMIAGYERDELTRYVGILENR